MKVFSILFGAMLTLVLATAAQAALITTGLDWHLDASDSGSLTLGAGNAVSQWNDTNPSVTPVNVSHDANNEPTLVTNALNGLPVVEFDGSDSLSNNGATPFGVGPYTLFLVMQAKKPATEQDLIDTTPTGDSRRLFSQSTSGLSATHGGATFFGDIDNAGYTPSHYVIYAVNWNGASSSTSVYNNGALTPTTVSGSLANGPASPVPNKVTVGGDTSDVTPDSFFTGGIAEILLYNSALDTTDFNADVTYLDNKWFVAPAPEPASLGLLAAGGLLLLKRRR